jgi:hypothetical protein
MAVAKKAAWTTRTAPAEHVAAKTADRGWFLPYLLEAESRINGRWNYWSKIIESGSIGDKPIPRLSFSIVGLTGGEHVIQYGEDVRRNRMLGLCGTPAEARQNVDWSFGKAFDRGARLDELAEWWLYGFGSKSVTEKPPIDPAAEVAMYCGLEVHRLLANPGDWAAHVATLYFGDRGGRYNTHAWFPTPMHVADMMVRMQFGDGDHRCQKVNDPCCGTGAMLLPASNYSLRLYGVDIDRTMCRLCEWQAWLYVPWLAYAVDDCKIKEFSEHDARIRHESGVADVVCDDPDHGCVLGDEDRRVPEAARKGRRAGIGSSGPAAEIAGQRLLFKAEP